MPHPLAHILETSLYVDDLDAAEDFYTHVLGLRVMLKEAGRHIFFHIGNRTLLLFDPQVAQQSEFVPPHGAIGVGHVCFAVNADALDGWKAHLQAQGVPIEKEIEWHAGARSIYFRDPAGNSLEFATPRIWGIDEA